LKIACVDPLATKQEQGGVTLVTDSDALAVVDAERLRQYLSTVVETDDTFDLGVLSGGLSNLTYVVGSAGREYVVRRRPLGPVAAGAHDMSREFRVQSALQGSGLPVAAMYGFCEDESILGAPFYVMGRVPGKVFNREQDVAEVTQAEASALSEATVDVLDRLHRVDIDSVGLRSLGRPEGFVARRIGRWLEQWQHSEHRDQPLVESIGEKLARSVPARTDSTLVHGDYRLGNMIVDPAASAPVAAVLDWEMSTLGDPMTDLAHLLVYWEPSRGRITHESQSIAQHPGFLRADQLAERYAAAAGREIADLDFYLAFEHWRAAIIKEGIYTRSLRTGSGESADAVGATVDLHLEEAAEILDIERR